MTIAMLYKIKVFATNIFCDFTIDFKNSFNYFDPQSNSNLNLFPVTALWIWT